MTNILEYYQLVKVANQYNDSLHGEVFNFHSKFMGIEVLVPELGEEKQWFIHGVELIQGSSTNYKLYLKDYNNKHYYFSEVQKLKYFYNEEGEPLDYMEISKCIVNDYNLNMLAKLYGIIKNENN